ncbi:MAG: tRNA (adenosine(37)-N6)-threonylcarbamoyltransferase complex dimerization subunit type 1 TsaB [Clostridia bacterium]|nr:tRNA (adenosine(37)-N6)-threonylcarbamoyltransferase complex dimerization subunit type 1 TsaB [Clostridia bacterium]
MITLAFDSTAKAASCAVVKDGVAIGCYTIDNGLTQSELLLPMAEDMLHSLKLDFSDIDLYAVSVGPGSFTGVRIGVALVKGLAFGKSTPCASVSTIEALAENLSGLCGIIVPCMDARRAQVYTGIFRSCKNGIERLTEDMAIPLSELAEMLRGYAEPIYLVGDGYDVARRALTELGIGTESTPPLLRLENAASVAIVAERIYSRGEAISDRDISPTYLRVPQAERERLEREADKN